MLKTSEKLIGKNLINGELREAASGEIFEVINPATGGVIGEAAFSGEEDVKVAVEEAKAAQKDWAKVPARERGQLLFEAARILAENKEVLAELMAYETGKAIRTECRPEVGVLPDTIEFFAGLGSEIKGETVPFDPKMLTMTIRQPVGVVGAILPWNAPLMLMAFKVAPALMCGNSVVVKSAEQSPLITLKAVELMNQVLPKGVLNIISGDGPTAGAALVAHPDVEKITFTGSVDAGREVYQKAASRLVPVTLELGGKSPMVIAEDADLNAAVAGAITGMRFTRQGQSCSAASRIFVHEDLHDAFLEKLVKEVDQLVMGDPLDEKTDIGAVVSKEQLEKVEYYVKKGEEVGNAHYCCELPKDPKLENGYFHRPVIFTEVKNTDEVAKNEIFGPVTCLLKWNDFDEVLKEANDTEYGLTATIWTKDLNKAMRGVHELEAGMVQVNQNLVVRPGLSYGGVKNSGLGKEACLEGMLEHFTHKKTAIINLGD